VVARDTGGGNEDLSEDLSDLDKPPPTSPYLALDHRRYFIDCLSLQTTCIHPASVHP